MNATSPFRAFTSAIVAHAVPPLDYVLSITDRTGTIQHATYDVPNRSTGYCTDDMARAAIVSIRAGRVLPEARPAALELTRTSLAFLGHAQCADGRFHNFMSFERTWLDDCGSEDSTGRAIWALGVATRSAPSFGFRAFARDVFLRALPSAASFESLRGRAFAALGIVEVLCAIDEDAVADEGRRSMLRDALATLGNALLASYEAASSETWTWFEDVMTYDNARLCEALLRAGDALNSLPMIQAGFATLAFYEAATVRDGMFVPVGSDGWYPKGGAIAPYAQQPLEAAALVDAALAAAAVSGRRPVAGLAPVASLERLAKAGLDWFYGTNSLGRSLVTPSGACADGLEASGVSQNAGAESTLAFLAAAYAMADHVFHSETPARPAETPVTRAF